MSGVGEKLRRKMTTKRRQQIDMHKFQATLWKLLTRQIIPLMPIKTGLSICLGLQKKMRQ